MAYENFDVNICLTMTIKAINETEAERRSEELAEAAKVGIRAMSDCWKPEDIGHSVGIEP